jgi:hypothetical protein
LSDREQEIEAVRFARREACADVIAELTAAVRPAVRDGGAGGEERMSGDKNRIIPHVTVPESEIVDLEAEVARLTAALAAAEARAVRADALIRAACAYVDASEGDPEMYAYYADLERAREDYKAALAGAPGDRGEGHKSGWISERDGDALIAETIEECAKVADDYADENTEAGYRNVIAAREVAGRIRALAAPAPRDPEAGGGP